MAISKTKNERPAIIELIDTVNDQSETVTRHGELIATNSGLIAAETDARLHADEFLTRSLGATNQQVLLLTQEVDDLTVGLREESAIRVEETTNLRGAVARIDGEIDDIQTWQQDWSYFVSDFRIGETESITVPANDSYSSSQTFNIPFGASDNCIVLLQVITGELSTLFDVTLIDCTYSGFSYQITNSDADSHDVKLGYVAVRTNRE